MSLARVERRLRGEFGLDAAALGPTALETAVRQRIAATGGTTIAKYAETLDADDAEWRTFVDALLVPESWFLRGGRGLFEELARTLMKRALVENRTARALCVPCGFGEEPYSLALVLSEMGAADNMVAIDAWDVSERHLTRARAGRYTAFSFREMDAATRGRHFRSSTADEWKLNADVRRRVQFQPGNLAIPCDDCNSERYDVVICRNVFIYLTNEARKTALANLDRWLAADGMLCLSPAEADRLPTNRFTRVDLAGALVYRRAMKKIRTEPASRAPVPGAKPTRVTLPAPVVDVRLPLVEIRERADRGEHGSALAACQDWLANHRPTADAFALLGVLLLASGDAGGAYDAFTRALYLQADHAESLEHLALLAEQRGDAARAAALRRKLSRTQGGGA